MSRSVVATLAIDGVEGVVAGFRKAGQASEDFATVASKAGDKAFAWVDKNSRHLDTVAGGLLKFGAAGGLALVGMAKAAIDWESAWAGVTKTVDGTPEQLAGIEKGLRGLAKTLPATHEEIAGVAEAAGQLGIKTDSIVDFTKTMIDLGETTNLSADEASTSLAQFMNVMGTSAKNVDRLGSAVVALGNDGASTERDIVQMGQRIAAAGASVRMSETDVLGFASALSSTGIEAEAGGTAISRTFRQIDGDVRAGGKSLQLLAQTSGMSAGEFKAAWETDAAGAVASFIEGLGGMQARGEDANKVLTDLGMKGERQTDSIMRLANATKAAGQEQNLLRESLELGKTSWDENSALAEEAAKRYETRSAQIQMSINGIKDEAINLGTALLPIVDQALNFVNSLVTAFSGLDQPTRNVGVAILTIGTSGALAAGGVIKLVTGLASAKGAINALGLSVGTVTKAMGIVGLAIAAAGVILGSWIGRQQEAKEKVDSYTQAIKEQGEVIGELTRAQAIQGLQDAGVLEWAQKLGVDLAVVTDAALGSESAMRALNEQLDAGTAATDAKIAANEAELETMRGRNGLTAEETGRMTDLINANDALGQSQSARVSMTGDLKHAIGEESSAVGEATAKAQQFQQAMGDSATATGTAATASEQDAAAKQSQAQAIQMTKEELDALLASTQAYGNALLALSGSQIGVESSIASLKDRMGELGKEGKDNAATLNLTTESGRKNQRALDDLAASSASYVKTLFEQGASTEEMTAATSRAKTEWIAAAKAMGMPEAKAKELAEAYFAIPERRETELTSNATAEEARVQRYRDEIAALPTEKRTELQALLDQGDVARVASELAALARTRTAYINVHMTAGGSSAPAMGRKIASANGNIVDFYASGGLRESHVAQIAPAGAMRVWAEPETGGEAYIPLAGSKRPRSLEIWRETGRRLGVHGFANGALLNAGRGAVTTTSTTTQHYTIELSFPAVRSAVQMERVLQRVPQLARQNGVALNG